jgi:hypothetical protein
VTPTSRHALVEITDDLDRVVGGDNAAALSPAEQELCDALTKSAADMRWVKDTLGRALAASPFLSPDRRSIGTQYLGWLTEELPRRDAARRLACGEPAPAKSP